MHRRTHQPLLALLIAGAVLVSGATRASGAPAPPPEEVPEAYICNSPVRRMQKPVVMLEYVGENHGLRDPANRKDYREFFDHYLHDLGMPDWLEKGVPYLDRDEHLKERAREIARQVEEARKARESGSGPEQQGDGQQGGDGSTGGRGAGSGTASR